MKTLKDYAITEEQQKRWEDLKSRMNPNLPPENAIHQDYWMGFEARLATCRQAQDEVLKLPELADTAKVLKDKPDAELDQFYLAGYFMQHLTESLMAAYVLAGTPLTDEMEFLANKLFMVFAALNGGEDSVKSFKSALDDLLSAIQEDTHDLDDLHPDAPVVH